MKKNIVKEKKIIFSIVSMEKGGAERVVATLANELCKNNDVSIMTLVHGDFKYPIDSKVNKISLATDKKKKNKFFKAVCFPITFIKRLLKMKKVFKIENPDIIISFLPETSFLSSFCKNKNSKLIISDRNDPKIEYKDFKYKFLMKKLYPCADGYVFQTYDAKKYFEDYIDFSKKEWNIIFNPVNPIFLNQTHSIKKIEKIVSVGRLQEQKNQKLLIDAFSLISKKFPEYSLVIYGEGPLRQELEEKIRLLKLEDKVFLPGAIDNIQDEIKDAKMFVMTSIYEGMPNALIEAMVLGLPVISSDCPCGGPKMLIKNGENGYLFESNNLNDLINKLEMLLNDEKKCQEIGLKATDIVNLVSSEKINTEWENIIFDVLNK